MYFDPRTPASGHRQAPCLTPGCRETLRVPDGRGKLPLFCSESHRKSYARTRSRLGAQLRSINAALERTDLPKTERQALLRERRFVEWHLIRFPAASGPEADLFAASRAAAGTRGQQSVGGAIDGLAARPPLLTRS